MSLPSFPALLDFQIAEKREFFDSLRVNARELTTGWRGSSLSNCLQAQRREANGEPKTRALDASTLRAFAWGDEIHHFAKKVYYNLGLVRHDELELSDEELNLTGHVDLVVGWPPAPVGDIPEELTARWSEEWMDFLEHVRGRALAAFEGEPGEVGIEIKSTHSNGMRRLFKEDKPYDHHAIQVGAYMLLAERMGLDIPRWRIEYIGKDSVGGLSFGVTPRWADVALQRVEELNASGLPACECEGWQVAYCNYAELLSEDEKSETWTCCDRTAEYVKKKR